MILLTLHVWRNDQWHLLLLFLLLLDGDAAASALPLRSRLLPTFRTSTLSGSSGLRVSLGFQNCFLMCRLMQTGTVKNEQHTDEHETK